MSVPNTPNTKYRPYFTAEQIDTILAALKSSSSDISLIRYLETFRAKIEFDAISKITPTPRISIVEKLGFNDPPVSIDTTTLKYQAYCRWCESPEELSMKELEYAHTYRYENDLMDSQEETDFEKQIGI